MRHRLVPLASFAVAVAVVGIAAGCGSEGVSAPTAQTVVGTLPKSTTPTILKGNPAAGKVVFTSAGCAGCHTYTPAGSKANVGPNLDNLPEYAQKAGQPLKPFYPRRHRQPAAEVRSAGLSDQRDADDVRPDAEAAGARGSRRLPDVEGLTSLALPPDFPRSVRALACDLDRP